MSGDRIKRSDFGQRVLNCLEREGIKTWSELSEHSSEDLLCIRDFGPGGLVDVIRALHGRGLSLADIAPVAAPQKPGEIRRPGLWLDVQREVLEPIEDCILARAVIIAERCRRHVLGEHQAAMDSLPRGWAMSMTGIVIGLDPGLGRKKDSANRDLLTIHFGHRASVSKPCPAGIHDVSGDPELLERVEALAATWAAFDDAEAILYCEVDRLHSEAEIIDELPALVRDRFAELVDVRQAARDRGEEVRP